MARFRSLLVLTALAVLLSACGPAAPQAVTPSAQALLSSPAATHTLLPSPSPQLPSPTPAPSATVAPQAAAAAQPAVISPENAASVRQVAQAAVADAYHLDWSEDGQRVGALSPEGLVLYDVAGLRQISTALVQAPVTLLDFSAETQWMAVTSDQMSIVLRDLISGSVAQTIDVGGMFMAASFSPDGRTLAVPLLDEIAIRLYDTATGQAQRTLTGFETAAPVYNGIFSADGKHVIWVSRGTVQVTDLESGASSPYFNHEDFVNAAALSPDGSILAVATAGAVNGNYAPFVQLWDAHSGQELGRLLAGQEPVAGLDFSPDGQMLASGAGTQVILWNVATRQQAALLSEHTGRVSAVAFSPSGRSLASVAADGALRIWQVAQ